MRETYFNQTSQREFCVKVVNNLNRELHSQKILTL